MNLTYAKDSGSSGISEILDRTSEDVVFIADPRAHVEPSPEMFESFARAIKDGAGLAYSDSENHPRIDYQSGSIRDNFDFGPVIAISVPAARKVWEGGTTRWAGLYDLRLRLSEKFPIVADSRAALSIVRSGHASLRREAVRLRRSPKSRLPDRNGADRDAHLRRIGAWLPPEFRAVPRSSDVFPVRGQRHHSGPQS